MVHRGLQCKVEMQLIRSDNSVVISYLSSSVAVLFVSGQPTSNPAESLQQNLKTEDLRSFL